MTNRGATGEVVDLDTTGMALGVFRGLGYRVNMEHTLEVGDVLLMTTDGAWECRNNDNMVFGRERLKRRLKRLADRPPRELLKTIHEDVKKHVGTRGLSDDLTLGIVMRVDP